MTRTDTSTDAAAVAQLSPQARTDLPGAYPRGKVLGVFGLVTAVLTAVIGWAHHLGPLGPFPTLGGPAWFDGWAQLDSGWYYRIAQDGYSYTPGQQSSIAFFPAYPMGVRVLGNLLGGSYEVAGILLAVLSGGAAVLLFGGWVWTRLPRPAAVTALAALMLYPYAFYLNGAMYADSLFLLTVIGSFVLVERRWFWTAGLVGAVATAGRPVGVAVLVGLVFRMLEQLAEDRARAADPVPAVARRSTHLRELVAAIRDVRWRQAGVLLSGAGLGSWCVYLWIEFGNPLAFVETEGSPGWDQGFGPRTWFKVAFFEDFAEHRWRLFAALAVQAFACACAVFLLRRVWRLFGWGYLAYAVVVLLIPIIGTKDFMGTGRYVLAAFPVMAAGGDFLASSRLRWLRPVALIASGALLLALTFCFGRSVEIS